MKINKIIYRISLVVITVALSGCTIYPVCWFFGCTNKAWYEIIQREQGNKCKNEESQKAVELCFDRQDKRSYEDYEIERKRSVKQ